MLAFFCPALAQSDVLGSRQALDVIDVIGTAWKVVISKSLLGRLGTLSKATTFHLCFLELDVMQRIAGIALIVISAAWSIALAAEMRSNEFIVAAIEGNLFEVKAGELAQTKGASDGVRQFGRTLANDHAGALQKSQQAAKAVNAKIPSSPSGTQRSVLDALAKLDGDKFDEHFIKSMADDHLRDVARYETQATQGSDAVAKYAAETLPVLREHLKSIQGLRNERATR